MAQQTIDLDHLGLMTGEDTELAAEVLELFIEQTKLWGRMLDGRAPAGQWADAAHSLKGSAGGVGALALAFRCGEVEALGRRGDASKAQVGLALSALRDEMALARDIAHDLILAFQSGALFADLRSSKLRNS